MHTTKNKVKQYAELERLLGQFKTPINSKYFIQVDTKRNCETPQLSYKVAGAVRKTFDMLFRLGRYQSEQNLQEFRTNFQHKYESRQIPLLEALDNEIGVGYSSNRVGAGNKAPLVDDIPATPQKTANHTDIKWTKTEEYYLKKYLHAIQNNEKEVVIQDNDFPDNDEKDWAKTTDSFDAMIQVINKPDEAQPLILFKAGGFGSAANMLGRFTHLDTDIQDFVRSIAQHESQCNPNAVLASVAHLPKPRFGNFMMREKIYDYEIPFLTNTNADDDLQIRLQDLYISVAQNRVILWSKKLNKEVIPRLSTAHNYSHASLPVYHFLCDLQLQHKVGIRSFNWGSLRHQFNFLPRVRYKNVIVHRATWQFKKTDLEDLISAKKQDRKTAFKTWQKKWEMPDLVYLIEGDNELLFNFKNDIFIELFVEEITKKTQIILSECLFNADNALVKDVDKEAYTNEVLVSFGKKILQKVTAPISNIYPKKGAVQRVFSPGSEWLYYKIYIGEQSANEVLLTKIQALLEQLQQKNLLRKWFFIRYNDSAPHLRLRLHLTEKNAFQTVIPAVHQALNELLNIGTIHDIQLDTYRRELERYGAHTIHLFERVFHHDSLAVCKALTHTFDSPNEQNLLLFAGLYSIDSYLTNLSYSLEEKRDIIKDIKTGFDKEFETNKQTSKVLNIRYKDILTFIENIRTDTHLQAEWLPIKTAIDTRSTAIADDLKAIQNLHKESHHPAFQDSIWAMLHMSVNRLAYTKARKHELLFHNLLFRYYNMLISTQKTVGISCFDMCPRPNVSERTILV